MSKKPKKKKLPVAALLEFGIFEFLVAVFNLVSNQMLHIGYQKTPLIAAIYGLLGIAILQILLSIFARKKWIAIKGVYYRLLILIGIPYLVLNIVLIFGDYILIYCELVSHICP